MNTNDAILENASVLCMKNAKQYIKDAEILHKFNSNQHALALTVLSDVELGKAVIYHLWSKGLIDSVNLPALFQSNFLEKKYVDFASETWWVGLAIASNVEFLIQEILDANEQAGNVTKDKLSALTMKKIGEVIEKMSQENNRLKEIESYRLQGFFVDSIVDENVVSVDLVKGSLVRDRIKKIKNKIQVGAPFLSLSFDETSKKIIKVLLEEAFRSIIPLRNRIQQFTFPMKD